MSKGRELSTTGQDGTSQDGVSRAALITGCGLRDGIGAATARALAKTGIAVMVADISRGGARPSSDESALARLAPDSDEWLGVDSLVEEIRAAGGTAAATIGDISSEADAERMVRETHDRFGSADILVNNAAAPQKLVDIEEFSFGDWERIFAVNVHGAFLMSRAAVKYMRKRGWGRVINISSLAAESGHPGHSAFSASKAAILGFTRALAADVGRHGITVMALSPGLTMTARGKLATQRLYGDDVNAGARNIAVQRYSYPEDIAEAVVFLASDASGYLSGEVIRFTGGGGL